MNAFVVAAALLSLPAVQDTESRKEKPGPLTTLEKLEREVAAVVERVRPSVVRVTAVFSVAPAVPRESLVFSGVVYTKDGAIVTDASGVAASAGLRVTIGEHSLPARHLASDRRTGVAVLKIEARGLRPARLADAPCRPGAVAIAVGNALGLEGTASFGTVSGVGRAIVVGGRTFDDMIQLTAAFTPGDCGGFVADSRGRLVGLIHSAYETGGKEGAHSSLLPLFNKDPKALRRAATPAVGFATPAAWVKFSADRILKYGRAVRGWLGLSARSLDAAARARLGLPDGVGAEIVRVKGDGPARRSGLAVRDILVEFDGDAVRDLDALQWKIAEVERPKTVKVMVLRDRKPVRLDVRIEIDPQE